MRNRPYELPRWTNAFPKVRRLAAFDPGIRQLVGFAVSKDDRIARLCIRLAGADTAPSAATEVSNEETIA